MNIGYELQSGVHVITVTDNELQALDFEDIKSTRHLLVAAIYAIAKWGNQPVLAADRSPLSFPFMVSENPDSPKHVAL